MKIIQRGNRPAEKIYQGTCLHCLTIVECKANELVTFDYAFPNDLMTASVCPVCSIAPIYVQEVKNSPSRFEDN